MVLNDGGFDFLVYLRMRFGGSFFASLGSFFDFVMFASRDCIVMFDGLRSNRLMIG